MWDSLKIDDLPNEELRAIARTIGLDVAIKVWREFRGKQIACPAIIDRRIVCRYMRENWLMMSARCVRINRFVISTSSS